MFSLKSKWATCAVGLLLILLVNACNPSANASSPGTYSIDPAFSDFYRETGGISLLGPAISPSFEKEGIKYQYVVAGLLVYDPAQIPLDRFHFSSIASSEWKINDLIEPSPVDSTLQYVNGHTIWEEIAPFYNRYGSKIIGLPLTGVRANDEKQRYEQYFESLGFYRAYSDPPGKIHLLPYGSWMCAANCQYQAAENTPPAASYTRDYSEIEQIFLNESEKLGYGFTGEPLSTPSMADDGYFEMVFQNVVMFIDPAEEYQIKLRPLTSRLGIKSDDPVEETKADWLSFYKINGARGYNIPNAFVDYLVKHGGMDYSGIPITEYRMLSDGGYTQCFTNLCIEYHPTAPVQLQVRPHALGIEYLRSGTDTPVPDPSLSEALQLNVWEQYPLIPSGQRQVIYVEALLNNAPVPGDEFSLVVIQPDGITKSYQLEPTGSDGRTSVELDPINGPNGAIVQYKVCILGLDSPQICFSRSYTIWNQ